MPQYDIAVQEVKTFTKQVYADSPEEALTQVREFYKGRTTLVGEPVVTRACSVQWYASVQDAIEDGWEDDETQYKYLRDELLGPFDSKEEARLAALKACPSWPVSFEEFPHSGALRYWQELDRGYRCVEVRPVPDRQLELPAPPAPVGVIEPAFAD